MVHTWPRRVSVDSLSSKSGLHIDGDEMQQEDKSQKGHTVGRVIGIFAMPDGPQKRVSR